VPWARGRATDVRVGRDAQRRQGLSLQRPAADVVPGARDHDRGVRLQPRRRRAPRHPRPAPELSVDEPLLEVSDLTVSFATRRATVHAVRGASFDIARGGRVGIAGESGSGKSVTALAIAGLLAPEASVTGSIRFQGEELTSLSKRRRRELCGTQIGMI